MGELGDDWREYKEYKRKKKDAYENSISSLVNDLVNHPLTKKLPDHWRIDDTWDFWWTGTVFNPKTKERTSINKLHKLYVTKQIS